jgi:hypothetical protein
MGRLQLLELSLSSGHHYMAFRINTCAKPDGILLLLLLLLLQ